MSPDLKEQVAAARDIVQLFYLERIVYVAATIIATLALFVSACVVVYEGKMTGPEIFAFLSSSGVFLGTASQVLRMFNRVMNAVLPEGDKK